MNKDQLTAIGLSPLQASAYALLLEQGEVKPSAAATKLGVTRTNAYKLFDKLVDLKLATRTETNKKFVYQPTNPVALASLAAEYRAEATAREEAVGQVMQDLIAMYQTHSDKPTVKVETGAKEVAELYRRQIALREDITFIYTAAANPAMGFDVMHEIRSAPARHDNKRRAIIPKSADGTTNPASHKRTNLDVTWATEDDYNAPVEWSVTPSSLLIVLYTNQPHGILIVDPVVAGAFLQLWKLMQAGVTR